MSGGMKTKDTKNLSKIMLGSWLNTEHGKAVCTKLEDDLVQYRYPAIPYENNIPQVLKQVWILRETELNNVSWLGESNIVSQQVATLTGPYGTEVTPKKKAKIK
jgi:hypothetical protein